MSKKIFIFVLILIFLLNSTACLKRVTIPPVSGEIKSHMNIIYVYMKPGGEYMGKSVLELKDAKVDDTFLTGMSESEKIKIRLVDINSIEVLRIDKKKIVIGSLIFITISIFSILYTIGIRSASVD